MAWSRSPPPPARQSDSVRILVIGAGSIGRRHAANLETLGAQVTLLPWRDTSGEDVVRRLADMDGAVIATATDIRLPLIAACGVAGVPFYCEKPLAYRGADLDAIIAAAAPVAARSMVGFMMRYHAAFRVLCALDLSDAFRFHMAIGHDVTQWRANWRFSDSYAARADGGGVLLDLCHEIDMAQCLFPGLALTGCDSVGHDAYPGVDMASHLTLGTATGATGTVAMDYLCPRLVRRTLVDTPTLSVDFDYAAGVYRMADQAGQQTLDLPQDRNVMFLDAMRDYLALVARGPTSDNRHLPRLDLTLPSCRLITAAWEARRFTGTTQRNIP
jgi:predicted dehydrogenase